MEYSGYMFWKGFILCRETNTKKFYYAGIRLPAHITTYDEGMHFVDKYIYPKVKEIPNVFSAEPEILKLQAAGFNAYPLNQGKHFPTENVMETIKKSIKDNWFYYKKK